MPTQRLTITPLSGGRIISRTIEADSAADLIKRTAWLIAQTARQWGISPLAVDYELEAV